MKILESMMKKWKPLAKGPPAERKRLFIQTKMKNRIPGFSNGGALKNLATTAWRG
jgi:hypothetical protein